MGPLPYSGGLSSGGRFEDESLMLDMEWNWSNQSIGLESRLSYENVSLSLNGFCQNENQVNCSELWNVAIAYKCLPDDRRSRVD